jgi:hypothetical protein
MRRKTRLSVETFEERITPSDLFIGDVQLKFPHGAVPGAKATLTIIIENNGDDSFSGSSEMVVAMNGTDANDSGCTGTVQDVTEKVHCAGCSNSMASMEPGEARIIDKQFQLPALDFSKPDAYKDGQYQLDVKFPGVLDSSGTPLEFTTDSFHYSYQFGTVPDPMSPGVAKDIRNVVLNVVMSKEPVSLELRGDGIGTLKSDSTLTFDGTDANSKATITGDGVFGGLTANQTIGDLSMPQSALSGSVNLNGGINVLNIGVLGNLLAAQTATIAAGGDVEDGDVLNIGLIVNASITDADPIKLLDTCSWSGTPAGDVLTAPAVTTLRTRTSFPGMTGTFAGNFGASLEISGNVGTATIVGKLGNAIGPLGWNIGGDVKTISVGTISTTGISAHSIAVFQVTKVGSVAAPSFDRASVDAGIIGLARLRDVAATTTGSAFGITAQAIDHYVRYAGTKVASSSIGTHLTATGVYDQLPDGNGDFRVTIL